MRAFGARLVALFPLAILLLLTSLGAAPAHAQVSVAARLSSERVYVGDVAQLSVEVAGSKGAEQPLVPDVPGLSIQFAGGQDSSRHSVMIINGRRTEETFEGYIYVYRVTPTASGRISIPPISIMVEGKEYKTEPLTLWAVEPGNVDGLELELQAEKTSVYVGEPVRVRLTWYIAQEWAREVSPRRLTLGADSNTYQLLKAPVPDIPGRQIEILDEPAVQGSATLDGQECFTITLDRTFIARAPGDVTLDPARLVIDTGDGFFTRQKRYVIASNPLTFDVKPLPSPQPPNFTGLIGEYSVEARASATDVHVGDPITLTVIVQGPEPLEAVPPIDFDRQPGFRRGFKTTGELSIPQIGAAGRARAAVFTTTIRAESDNITEIPPIELAYFDVTAGSYGVARSEPIPLNVRPTTEVVLPGQPAQVAPAQREETERVGGLAPIVTSVPRLTQGRFDLVSTLRSPAAIALAAGPMLLYLGTAGLVALRRRAERDPARRRRHAAQSRALRRLARAARRAAGPAEIAAALRGYVADRFNLPEAGITSSECAARLRQTGIPSAPRFADFLDRSDAALFGGTAAAVTADEARELIRATTRELEEHP